MARLRLMLTVLAVVIAAVEGKSIEPVHDLDARQRDILANAEAALREAARLEAQAAGMISDVVHGGGSPPAGERADSSTQLFAAAVPPERPADTTVRRPCHLHLCIIRGTPHQPRPHAAQSCAACVADLWPLSQSPT
jgi:hypothetical protein